MAEALASGPAEIAVIGPPGDDRTAALHRTALLAAPPGAVIALGHGDGTGADTVPLLAGRELVGGAPAAYVCRDFACRMPVTDPERLRAELGSGGRPDPLGVMAAVAARRRRRHPVRL